MVRRTTTVYETVDELLNAMKNGKSTFHKHHGKVVIEGSEGLYVQSDNFQVQLGGDFESMKVKDFLSALLEKSKYPIIIK